jgi:DNA-binding winged helix-turn-helix (wHTH) protein
MLRFGEYRLDLDNLQILRGNARLEASAQIVEVLAFLIENRERIVSREELLDRFWPRAGIGADAALNTCIRRIRLLLDDSADAPRFLQTRPRQGYRFLAPVDTDVLVQPRSLRVPVLAGALLAVLASGGIAAVSLAEPTRLSVAIEPASNLCEYVLFPRFNAGLRESLTAETARRLPPNFDLVDASRDADFRMRTSVRQTPRATSVTLTLVKASDGTVLWSEEFAQATSMEDYVPIQRALAARIARSASTALAMRTETARDWMRWPIST